MFTSMQHCQRKRVDYRGVCICGSGVRIGTNNGTRTVPESPPASVKQQKFSRPRGLHHWPSELATLENTLFAFPPISRIVPTTITRITASITAYSAMSWPSSLDHISRKKLVLLIWSSSLVSSPPHSKFASSAIKPGRAIARCNLEVTQFLFMERALALTARPSPWQFNYGEHGQCPLGKGREPFLPPSHVLSTCFLNFSFQPTH